MINVNIGNSQKLILTCCLLQLHSKYINDSSFSDILWWCGWLHLIKRKETDRNKSFDQTTDMQFESIKKPCAIYHLKTYIMSINTMLLSEYTLIDSHPLFIRKEKSTFHVLFLKPQSTHNTLIVASIMILFR